MTYQLLVLLPTLNFLIALASLGMLVAVIALAIDLFIYKGTYFAKHIKPWLWPGVMVLTTASVVMSLVYSEFYGFIPCSLCWLQRIAIYPQALLSVMAYRMRDQVMFPLYGVGLSIFGFLVAVYQYVYQMIPREALEAGIMPCLADGSNADCAEKVIDQFGFVTFPFVSAVTFLLLIVLYLYLKKQTQNGAGKL